VLCALLVLLRCGSRTGLLEPETDAAVDASPPGCVELVFDYEPRHATVLLLVDRSGSMNDRFGSGTRWSVLGSALFDPDHGVVASLQDTVRFGIALYTSDNGYSGGACPDLIEVPIAPDNAAAVQAAFDGTSPARDGDTPTGNAIRAVLGGLAAYSAPKYILLVTDGEPDTCAVPDPQNGQSAAVAAAELAYQEGVRLLIMGVSADIAPAHLQHMANAGMGAPITAVWGIDEVAGQPHQASDDQAELAAQLVGMLGAQRVCLIDLEETVDPSQAAEANVLLDGQALQHGDWDGWVLRSTSTLEVLGTACDSLLATSRRLSISYPCDTVSME
jgi:hypothetical protein